MTNPSPRGDGSGQPAISAEQASTLLRFGLSEPTRPIDELIDRLHADGGRELFETLAVAALAGAGLAPSDVLEGRATIDQLLALKHASKNAADHAQSAEQRWAGTLGYFLAVSAALHRHARLISSRPRTEVNIVLVDLADPAPAAWGSLLLRASVADCE